MRLKQMILSGFRSFASEWVLDFEPGPLFLLGENRDAPGEFSGNGAGKSSLFLALCWALMGELPTGAKKDQVVHRECDETSVTVVFEGLTVCRSKKRGQPERLFLITPEGRIDGDLGVMQEKLEKILGISPGLFYNSVWIDAESKTVQFLFARPAERLKILEEMITQDLFAQAKARATRHLADLKMAIQTAQMRRDDLQQQAARETTRMQQAQSTLESYRNEVQQRLTQRKQQQKALEAKIRDLKQRIDALKQQPSPSQVEAELRVVENRWDEANKVWATVKGKIAATLELAPGACPTCGKKVSQEDAQARQDLLLSQQAGLRKAQEIRDATAGEAKTKRGEYYAIKGNLQRISEMSGQLRALQGDWKELQDTPPADPETERALKSSLTMSQALLSQIEKEIEQVVAPGREAEEQTRNYKFWEEGFGSKGIRTLLLDDIRATMEYYVGRYLQRMAGDQIKITFPFSDRGFEVMLETPGGPTDISTFSRGEAWRANLSVLLALRKTMSFLQTTQLDLLCLDDPLVGLDEAGQEAIVAAVLDLSKEFSNVFVTLPHPIPGLPADKVLKVVKEGGESYLEAASL
ncbi:MAG TPA: AAA family ATPase [bacterium]|nr:AAA family ATPase [bacterium]